MANFTFRGVLLSAAILVAACSSSTGPSKFEQSVAGTYQLKTVRGSALPVSLFGQCTLNQPQPCSACTASATSGTLTLTTDPLNFTLSLVASGLCTDPQGRSPTSGKSYTISAGGKWSKSGSDGITFESNNMNFASATVSGSTLSASFNWLNNDPGGQPAAVTATFSK